MCNRQNNFIQVLRSYVHEASLVDQHFMLCFLVEERFKQTSTLCMLVKILKITDDSLPTGYTYTKYTHTQCFKILKICKQTTPQEENSNS